MHDPKSSWTAMEFSALPQSQHLPSSPKAGRGLSMWVFLPAIILLDSLYLCPKDKRFWKDFLVFNLSCKSVFAALDIGEGNEDLRGTLDGRNGWRGPATTAGDRGAWQSSRSLALTQVREPPTLRSPVWTLTLSFNWQITKHRGTPEYFIFT